MNTGHDPGQVAPLCTHVQVGYGLVADNAGVHEYIGLHLTLDNGETLVAGFMAGDVETVIARLQDGLDLARQARKAGP